MSRNYKKLGTAKLISSSYEENFSWGTGDGTNHYEVNQPLKHYPDTKTTERYQLTPPYKGIEFVEVVAMDITAGGRRIDETIVFEVNLKTSTVTNYTDLALGDSSAGVLRKMGYRKEQSEASKNKVDHLITKLAKKVNN